MNPQETPTPLMSDPHVTPPEPPQPPKKRVGLWVTLSILGVLVAAALSVAILLFVVPSGTADAPAAETTQTTTTDALESDLDELSQRLDELDDGDLQDSSLDNDALTQ